MRIGHFLLGTVIVLIVAGCQRQEEAKAPAPAPQAAAPAEPAVETPLLPTGFQHDPDFDASGYFMSRTPVKAGTFQLRNIAIGAPSDFAQWETGGRNVFGPILFDFEDTASPKVTNELGGEAHAVTARVLPAAYRFGPGDVTFQGQDPKVGAVIFTGAFDAIALAAARQSGSSDGRPVLTGSLQVGGERIGDISFSYWAGD